MRKTGLIIGIIAAVALLCTGIIVGGIFAFFKLKSGYALISPGNSLSTTGGNVGGNLPGSMSMISLQDFTSDPVYKIGNHIYYSDNMFDKKNASVQERKEVKEYLEKADATLSEDVYVNWYSEDTLNNNLLKVNATQYVNGVICPRIYYSTDTYTRTDPNIKHVSDFPPVQNLDTSNLLDPTELFDDVKNHAKSHTKEMLMDRGKDKIYGTYQAEYDVLTDTIEYHFTVNTYSDIYADARTGRITKENYWDGVYID